MVVAVVVIVVSMVIYYAAERPELAPAFPVDVPPAAAVATIIAFAPWTYVGFDSIPQLAGEFNFSPKKALGLLLWGITVATLIYLAMMLATSIAVGPITVASKMKPGRRQQPSARSWGQPDWCSWLLRQARVC